MFYTIADGNFTNINCQQTSNSEVSGFGIRYTHYLQALLSILLAFKQPTPAAMLFNNLASPAVSIFLVAAAYFDVEIDVLDSILVSHFVVMFSACNNCLLDFSTEVTPSRNGGRAYSRGPQKEYTYRSFLKASCVHARP